MINRSISSFTIWLSVRYSLCTFMTVSIIYHFSKNNWASLMAQWLKNSPAVQETQVWSLSQEDPLEKEMATPPALLLEKYMDSGVCCATTMGSQRFRHDWATKHKAIIDQQFKNLFVWNLYELMTGHIVHAFQFTFVIFLIDVHIGQWAFPQVGLWALLINIQVFSLLYIWYNKMFKAQLHSFPA